MHALSNQGYSRVRRVQIARRAATWQLTPTLLELHAGLREAMGSTWSYLDLTALGRQEGWEDSPDGYPQTAPYQWWHLPDEYEQAE